MANKKYIFNIESLHSKYIIAFLIGTLVGFKALPGPVVGIVYLILAGVCIFHCLRGDVSAFFTLLPYVVYTEVFVRGFVRWVPYLTLQYSYIVCFLILMIKGVRLKKSHSFAFYLLIMYSFLEVANNLYPDKPDVVRAIMFNSFALLMPVVWASYNVLKPVLINKLLNNIKVASIYLSGVVFVAHFTGKIDYGLYSNSDSSNGLAPVQLSGYLGLGCILFFLSIMNPEELKNRLMNIVVLALAATVMILTFSRGGLYFLGAVIAMFLFYNRDKMASYARLLIFIPIGLFIYFYVVNTTGGKIVDRYEQEGTSNRNVLVAVGFTLFERHMLFGVGTGNYNTAIIKEKLFYEESGAHNEYVRAAAEHGIFGILFYWGFYIFLLLEILHRRQPQKQYAMYFFVLFCLIIVHNGLKIAIQPLLLMLAVGTPSLMSMNQRNAANKELTERRVA